MTDIATFEAVETMAHPKCIDFLSPSVTITDDLENQPIPKALEPFTVAFEANDKRDPMNFTRRRKWAITLAACSFTVLVSACATSYNLGIPSMMHDLHCTHSQATLGLSTYVIGFGIFPLFTSAFSEEFGRQPLYFASVLLFLLMHIVIALARNIQVVIVARLIQGAAGSTGATMVAGTVADIWLVQERGLPMTLFAVAAFSGNSFGSLIGGWVEMDAHLGWKWIQWISFIVGGCYYIAFMITMQETRASVILYRLAKKYKNDMGGGCSDPHELLVTKNVNLQSLIWISCTRPITFLVTEPIVFAVSLWIGFAWGVFYCMIASMPVVFRTLHGFNSGQIGTVYLTMFIGTLLGFCSNFIQERVYQKRFDQRRVEARLYMSCLAGILFPLSMLMYAWFCTSKIPWILLAISVTIYLWAMFTIYLAVFSYLADCYGTYASSALAGQSLFRNVMGGIFPLFTERIFNALGYTWANTIFACVAALMAPIPFIIFFWGPSIRSRSKRCISD